MADEKPDEIMSIIWPNYGDVGPTVYLLGPSHTDEWHCDGSRTLSWTFPPGWDGDMIDDYFARRLPKSS